MMLQSTEVVILAGGASQRMGSPKALLHFSKHETFLDHILAVYRAAGIERSTVVWAESARRDTRVLHSIANPRTISLKTRHVFHEDFLADRLASVLLGLRITDSDRCVFLQDVDRPFITWAAIQALLASQVTDGYAAPRVSGSTSASEIAGHPLLLTPPLIRELLDKNLADPCIQNERSSTLRDLLRDYPCTLVSVGSEEVASELEININTPADYRRYFRLHPCPAHSSSIVQ